MMIFSRLNIPNITFSLVLSTLLFIANSCSKDNSDDDDVYGNWKVSSEFEGLGRSNAVTFTIGDLVYVGLGYNKTLASEGNERPTDFWAFQKSSGTWKRVAPFPGKGRNSAVAFVVNGIAYVGSGYDGTNRLSDFWSYNPTTDTWVEIANLADFGGTARYGAVAFSLGSKGYISTGYDGNTLKDLWEYDPASNTWQQKASLAGSKRQDAVAFVYNNKAYVVSGTNNSSLLSDFYYYDQASDSWTRLRNINSSNDDEDYDDDYGSNITRSGASVFLLGNKAYLCCGRTTGVTNTVWEYNIDTDLWEPKTGMEGSAREYAIGFAQGGIGYITTGTNGSSYFDDLWEFYPDQEQTSTDNY